VRGSPGFELGAARERQILKEAAGQSGEGLGDKAAKC
jgi:hypothetical protein